MSDAPAMRSGPLQLGVQLSTEIGKMPEVELQDLRSLQPQLLRLDHLHSADDAFQLAEMLPGISWIIGARMDSIAGSISPERYVDEVINPGRELLRALQSSQYRNLALELQPRPNELADSLASGPWRSGEDFGKWWLSVFYLLREMLSGVELYFPSLNQTNQQSSLDPAVFINDAREFINQADGVGVNIDYTSDETDPKQFLQYVRSTLAPYNELDKPLWLTSVRAEIPAAPYGGQPLLYTEMLRDLDENYPLVHGVIFQPFYSEDPQEQRIMWAGSAAMPQYRSIFSGDYTTLVDFPETYTGYVWQGSVDTQKDGRLLTKTQTTLHTGPNPSSDRIGVLASGTLLTTAGEPKGSYTPVSVAPTHFLPPESAEETLVEGWVWAEALEIRPGVPTINRNVGVNVRRGPKNEFGIIGVLRRGAQVEVVGDEENEFLPIRALSNDLVVQNNGPNANSPERVAQTLSGDSPRQETPGDLSQLELPSVKEGYQDIAASQVAQQQQKIDQAALPKIDLNVKGVDVNSGESNEAQGQWLFRFAQEWPEVVWPREQLELLLEIENRTEETIPGGELWVREWVQRLDTEERKPAGDGILIDNDIAAGETHTISVPYQMPREAGDYRWYFELETGSLTPPRTVPSLVTITRVLADEEVWAQMEGFATLSAEGRQALVHQARQTIPYMTVEDGLREPILKNILLTGLVDEDWHVSRDALEALHHLRSTDLGSQLDALAQERVAATENGVKRLEATLTHRMRNEIKDWARGWLPPLPEEDPTDVAEISESPAVAEVPFEAPTVPAEVEPARARPVILDPIPATPPIVRDIQINVNQQLAASEPAGTQDRLTITVTNRSVLARLTLNGQEFSYASPFKLDKQALLQLSQDSAAYGELLFRSILHDEPMPGGDRLTATINALNRAQTNSNDLVIELFIDPAAHSSFDPADLALHSLWWERLKQPNLSGVAKSPLATLKQAPFYRRLIGPAKPALKANPLKVLVAICNPHELGGDTYSALERLTPVDVAQERDILEDALRPLKEAGVGEFEILGGPANPASWKQISKALQQDYHVLHVVAHGIFFHGNFSLVMEGDNGEALFISPDEFQQQIGANNSLRLVTLTSCQSAIDSSGSSLQGLGPRLVQNGVPAVIAMQDLIQVNAAQLFHQYFYNALARHGRVDRALATARHHLFHEVDDDRQWAIPVLFLGSGDGQLFEPEGDAGARLSPLEAARAKTYHELAGAGDPSLAKASQQLRSDATQLGFGPEIVAAMQAFMATGIAAQPNRVAEAHLAVPQNGAILSAEINQPVKISAAQLRDYVLANTPLKLDRSIFPQLAAALSAGKHIVLTGPPGTGKTSLALALAELATNRSMNRGARLTTATPDWTTFDTIGGYVPSRSQTLQFKPGLFLETIREGHWLIIDEMNRAEIDKAFGELFTVLSGQQVDLPYTVGDDRVRILPPAGKTPADWWPKKPARFDYVCHPNWRIIGTMNVFDRSFLFSMSFAFMRRFAFIDVAVPQTTEYADLRRAWLAERLSLANNSPDLLALSTQLDAIFDQGNPLMQRRALGPAIALDIIRYLAERGAPWSEAVAEAMMLYVVPQLDGLEPTAIFAIHKQLKALFGENEQRLLLPRIHELYPHIRVHDWEQAENDD